MSNHSTTVYSNDNVQAIEAHDAPQPATRVTIDDGKAPGGSFTRAHDTDLRRISHDRDRDAAGVISGFNPITHAPVAAANLQPTDYVRIQGLDMSVAMAEQLGYLQRTAAGYTDSQPAAAPAEDVPFSQQEGTTQWAASVLEQRVGGDSMIALVSGAVAGTLGPAEIRDIAHQAGMTQEQLDQELGTFIAAMGEALADEALAVHGLQAEDMANAEDWARKHHAHEWQAGLIEFGISGNGERLLGLLGRFVKEAPIAPEALEEIAVPGGSRGDQLVTVEVNGMRITTNAATAAAQGWI